MIYHLILYHIISTTWLLYFQCISNNLYTGYTPAWHCLLRKMLPHMKDNGRGQPCLAWRKSSCGQQERVQQSTKPGAIIIRDCDGYAML